MHHFVAIGKFKLELQTRNAQFGSKSAIFLSHVTLKFEGWPWKTVGHLFYATSSFVHHFIAICEFKLELQSGNGQIVFWPLWPWPLTSDLPWTSLLSITPENFMMIWWQEYSEKGVTDWRMDGQTDGLTERGVLRAAWSQLKRPL